MISLSNAINVILIDAVQSSIFFQRQNCGIELLLSDLTFAARKNLPHISKSLASFIHQLFDFAKNNLVNTLVRFLAATCGLLCLSCKDRALRSFLVSDEDAQQVVDNFSMLSNFLDPVADDDCLALETAICAVDLDVRVASERVVGKSLRIRVLLFLVENGSNTAG